MNRSIGKYRIVGQLGHGGMGVVYEALDTVLERPVAIKILPKAIAGDPDLLRRFRIEAQAAARLNHPNALTVHDVGHEGGYHYLAMELVRGKSAQELIRAGPLPWREATRIIRDACRGLAAAHAAGVLHRDIKPANILCDGKGTVKLADFGLAKFTDRDGTVVTAANTVIGTPHFMSPEQCRGETVDDLSDIYALGATWYALLTGQPPYHAEGHLEVMYAHCTRPIPDPRTFSQAPEVCARLVQRVLAKEPMDRPRGAAALADELDALLNGTAADRPVAPPAPSLASTTVLNPLTTPSVPPALRLPPSIVRWLAVAGGLGLAVLLVWLVVRGVRSDAPAAIAWKPLFNDKDLTGWKVIGQQSQWSVADGVLTGRGDNTFLVTKRDDFQDFRVRLEVQLSAGGNSGLFFRCDDSPGLPVGYEVQIGEQLGQLHRNIHGFSSPYVNEQRNAEPDRWYKLELFAKGPRIQAWIDGRQTIDFVEREPSPERGRIGLQSFGPTNVVRFRKIEIQEEVR